MTFCGKIAIKILRDLELSQDLVEAGGHHEGTFFEVVYLFKYDVSSLEHEDDMHF